LPLLATEVPVARRMVVLPSALLLTAVGVLGTRSFGAAADPAQTTGFTAVVSARHAYVRSEPSDDSPILGTVEAGAQLQVIRCLPQCDAKDAWALLADGGAIRRALLELSGRESAGIPPSEQQYRYATVLARGAKAYARPDVRAQVVEELPPHRVIALAPEQPEAASGWMQRIAGSYVRAAELRLARPSALQGEFLPKLPLAFVAQRVPPNAAVAELPKYQRFAILEERPREIRTAAGRIDRRFIRIARRRSPPSGLPERAKWVQVDLCEQTLVAYEGQQPVFATVVSTGVRGKRTLTGLHRVWLKTAHDRMHGRGYDLEEVPYTLYFKHGQALHGAFWHDQFGRAITHGCVNLSMADARWLFQWAPPPLPAWWHSIVPQSGVQTLWVLVEGVEC